MVQKNLWLILNYSNTNSCRSACKNKRHNRFVKVFAARSKAKAKPQRRELVDVPSIIPMNERKSIDIEPGEFSFFCVRDFEESDQPFSTHSNSTTRRKRSSSILEDKNYFPESNSTNSVLGLMVVRKYACQQEEERKRDINCTDASGTIDYFRAFQVTLRTQFHWSFITGQCDNSERDFSQHSYPTFDVFWIFIL